MLNALSFDVEEWYHPQAIQDSGLRVERFSQVVEATTPLLDLLQRHAVKATFFTVGEVAQAHPHLIEKMLKAGHELAFHGWTHKPLWALNPASFAAEIEQFLQWRDVHFPGVPILGYRAPTFSLDHTTAWAIEVLCGHGFEYDSSIFPAQTPLYGVPEAPLEPFQILTDNNHLIFPVNGERVRGRSSNGQVKNLQEIPMSVFPLLGRRIGFTGGLYLRALPWWVIKRMFHSTHAAGRAAVLYIHPWETYAPTPRLKLSRWGRFVLYYGLPALPKLEKLLQTFAFSTMQQVFLNTA